MAKIVVDLVTQTSGWTKGLDGAGKDVKQFVANASKTVKSLTFQPGGGGAAGFATALAAVSKGAEEAATALRTGAGYGEVFSKAVDKIPIVGQFKQAGESIRELITGEKAALIQAEKMAESAQKVADAYRRIAVEKQGEGLRGGAKEAQTIEDSVNSKITGLHTAREALTKQLQEIQSKDANIGWYTDAQEAAMKQLQDQIKANDSETQQARKHGTAQETERQADALHARELAEVESARRVGELRAQMHEVALRRQGKALESAIEKEKQAALERKNEFDKAAAEEARPHELNAKALAEKGEDIKAKKEADIALQIRANYAKQSAVIDEALAQTIDELNEEHERHRLAVVAENQEKIKEIQANGAIERLKIEDENINARNERDFISTRSHLAEKAQIEEEYRKAVEAAEKSHLADSERRNDANDPVKQAEIEAAAEEKKQKLGLLGAKSVNETAKNALEISKKQEEHLKELRKLWEDVGTPQQKYAAKLEDIQANFEKFHDSKLRDKEIEKLDRQTFEDLKKQNPDHDPKVELYGRTQSYSNLESDHKGTDIAQQQFAEMKKNTAMHEDFQNKFRDVWNYFQKLGTGIVQEIGI